jgi:DNA-binding CsgD family transcriptional regulator
MVGDILSLIETAYRFDLSDKDWLRELAVAANGMLGVGRGFLGFTYRVDDDQVKVGESVLLDLPEELVPATRSGVESLPPWYVRKTFTRCECTTQSAVTDEEVVAFNRPRNELFAQAFGIHDVLMFGGMDPSGDGLYLGAWLPTLTTLPEADRETWCRVAVHLVTARRLRERLARDPSIADAVLRTDGRVEEARGEATEDETRSALRDAVVAVERARGSLRTSPDRAVEEWKGLVAARWTLVDHFESDGKRYVLARRNDIVVEGFDTLTERERQALSYAALGHSNKLIAYELGIADSTVRVLLHKAARKLGATSHEDLVRKYETGRAADGEEKR